MTRVVIPGRDPSKTRVADVMTTEVVTASLEEHVDFCVDKMKRVGCRHLPVVCDGRVIGMVSMRDLLRDEIEEQDHEIRNLRAYLHQEPPL
ncbi:MAG: CBS domain-containing protein [Deltaproteobacteria bacterium]|nr:CBS domain-containing protein [Deltaproteobacteria bacterium]MBW2360201.1 CBS domain-containing protein [Deltaproteobacteria bacterium]